jgi:hypothetical protein
LRGRDCQVADRFEVAENLVTAQRPIQLLGGLVVAIPHAGRDRGLLARRHRPAEVPRDRQVIGCDPRLDARFGIRTLPRDLPHDARQQQAPRPARSASRYGAGPTISRANLRRARAGTRQTRGWGSGGPLLTVWAPKLCTLYATC